MSKILAFSGSNHSKSINQALASYASSLVQNHDVKLIDLRDFESPLFSIDLENENGHPDNIIKLEKLISEQDALIIALPEYNGSMTSFFKNTLDWLTRVNHQFLKDKKLILLSTSPGKFGAKFGLAHTAGILPRFGCEVLGTFSLGNFHELVSLNGEFTLSDTEKLNELKSLIHLLENNLKG